jgi:hypothetical protein
MNLSHLSFIIPTGADTPMFFWLTGFIGFPITFLSLFFWWVLKQAANEDRVRILRREGDKGDQY